MLQTTHRSGDAKRKEQIGKALVLVKHTATVLAGARIQMATNARHVKEPAEDNRRRNSANYSNKNPLDPQRKRALVVVDGPMKIKNT